MKKKRVILLTLVLSVMTMFSFAQVGSPKTLKTSFGVKAGVNMSTIVNNQSEIDITPGSKIGYAGGVFANIHFGYRDEGSPVGTGVFGLQPEILYSNQGFSSDDLDVELNYITVPVMLKFYATNNFNVELGPYFSYLLSSASESTVVDGTQISLQDLEGGTDYGIAAGLSYEANSGFVIGVRYSMGMADMASNLQWRNSNIAATLGWLF